MSKRTQQTQFTIKLFITFIKFSYLYTTKSPIISAAIINREYKSMHKYSFQYC